MLRVVDAAFGRRILLTNFKYAFNGAARDYTLAAKLESEAPAVLAWMIVGAAAWYRDGLCPPAEIAAAGEAYLEQMDEVAAFLGECCDIQQARIAAIGDPSSLLYCAYQIFARSRGSEILSQKRLTPMFEQRGLERGGDEKRRGFRGVYLTDEWRERARQALEGDGAPPDNVVQVRAARHGR